MQELDLLLKREMPSKKETCTAESKQKDATAEKLIKKQRGRPKGGKTKLKD